MPMRSLRRGAGVACWLGVRPGQLRAWGRSQGMWRQTLTCLGMWRLTCALRLHLAVGGRISCGSAQRLGRGSGGPEGSVLLGPEIALGRPACVACRRRPGGRRQRIIPAIVAAACTRLSHINSAAFSKGRIAGRPPTPNDAVRGGVVGAIVRAPRPPPRRLQAPLVANVRTQVAEIACDASSLSCNTGQ